MKKDLLKRRSDEEVAEPWVECDTCGYWVHQVCALYYDFDGSDSNSTFQCPMCTLERHSEIDFSKAVISNHTSASSIASKQTCTTVDGPKEEEMAEDSKDPSPSDSGSDSGEDSVSIMSIGRSICRKYDSSDSLSPEFPPNSDPNHIHVTSVSVAEDAAPPCPLWKASSLPRTKISDLLEEMVKALLKSSNLDDVVDSITIRMVSNRDHKFDVPKNIIDNMMTADGSCIPDQLAYRQKCILLFQKIGGVDVCLFCLYVQEFDETCPAPNTSTVYIAYLDSVDYFRPMEARTRVYQEIMVGYLKWAQIRGFKQGHIWSCPPQRGDNFIFNIHPHHQRTPARERLNSWYNSILLRASKLGIITDVDTLWDKYFSMYTSREEPQPRQAAKNSLVGSGKVTNLTRKYNSSKKSDVAVRTELTDIGKPMQIGCEREVIPICPPIFEGDLWVLESLRVNRSIQSICKGSDGGDVSVNQRKCRELLRHLMAKHTAAPFLSPVDADYLNIPTYHTIITHPMDLGTVRDNLRQETYTDVLSFTKVNYILVIIIIINIVIIIVFSGCEADFSECDAI